MNEDENRAWVYTREESEITRQSKKARAELGLSTRLTVGIYAATLLAFLAASFFTQSRAWGLATWGYLPIWGRIVLLLIGIGGIPLVLKFVGQEHQQIEQGANNRTFLIFGSVVLVLSACCFWFFRGSTHFLGDGYLNISTMSAPNPVINFREFGESITHLWLTQLLGGPTREHVLLSYQLISIGAGILLVLLTLWVVGRLYQDTLDRILFTLGILSTGQLLLFFGYVENYALFAVAVAAFTFSGILVAREKLGKAFILIPLSMACFLHVLGVTMVPAAAYILFSDSSIAKKIGKMSPTSLVTSCALVIVIGTIGLWKISTSSPFFRLALMGPVSTRFTVDGYTLFSTKHVVDYFNLIILLFPAIPLLVTVSARFQKQLRALPEYRFVALLLLSGFGAVFIFDPKLGMPRDWDCFSFPAVGLAALLVLVSLDRRIPKRSGVPVLVFSVLLGMLSLSARVATHWNPSMGVSQIEDYISFDPIKQKSALICLQEYYSGIGDTAGFKLWGERFQQYPDEQLVTRADSLIGKNKLTEAYACLQQAIQVNPMASRPYTFLSVIYLRNGSVSKARFALDTALILNPTNPQAHVGMGYLEQVNGKIDEAKRWYHRSIEIAPEKAIGHFYLARLELSERDTVAYLQEMTEAISKSDAGRDMCLELSDACAARGEFSAAAAALKRGTELNLDAAVVSERQTRYPQMKLFLGNSSLPK